MSSSTKATAISHGHGVYKHNASHAMPVWNMYEGCASGMKCRLGTLSTEFSIPGRPTSLSTRGPGGAACGM